MLVIDGDGWGRHGARDGFALLVATRPGEGEIDALADEDEGEGGGAPVVDVVSWVEPDVAVGGVEGGRDERREQEEADEVGVWSSAEVGHECVRDELEEGEGGRLPCNRDAVLVGRYESSECPGPPRGQPAIRSEMDVGQYERKKITLGTTLHWRSRCSSP